MIIILNNAFIPCTTAIFPVELKDTVRIQLNRKPTSGKTMVTSEAAIRKAKQQMNEEQSALDAGDIMHYYEKMLEIRRFEEKAGQLYGMGLVGGFCHLYIGQEAVVVGMQSCLEEGDQIITTYRDHGHMIAVDTDPKVIFAELLGRADGCSRGKGGSMHMFDLKNNFYGGHGIVGANVPIGTGLAFANKYRGNNKVSVAYFGDGAANQGQVYESFNMAKLWNLPVIYVIENNEYAMGTSVERSSSATELYKRGAAHGINGYQVDGMDLLAVRKAGTAAVEHARSGKGPVIIEMKTYRYRGHSMSDPANYRSREEVQRVKEQRDPIEHVKDIVLREGYANEEKLKEIDKKIRKRINEAVEFAKSSPEPDPSELWTDVYVD